MTLVILMSYVPRGVLGQGLTRRRGKRLCMPVEGKVLTRIVALGFGYKVTRPT